MSSLRMRTLVVVGCLGLGAITLGCSSSGSGGGDVCTRANNAAASCSGNGGGSSPAESCNAREACYASCVLASPCDNGAIGSCVFAQCSATPTDGGTGSDTSTPPRDSGSPFADTGGGTFDGAPVPPQCQTYADKAYGCCSSSSSCSGVTRDDFVRYCAAFYASCTKFYSCYISAASCSAAEACPTAGSGGCS